MVSIKNIETESSHSHQNQIFFGGKLVPPSKQVSLLFYSPWAPTFQSWRDEPQYPVTGSYVIYVTHGFSALVTMTFSV